MLRRWFLALCIGAGMLWFPMAASAAAPDTASSPPDSPASVNSTPNGVWSTAAAASQHSSSAVSPAADGHGCPSSYGCGWVNSGYGGPMGKWAGNNPNFTVFGQSQCQDGNWNDCISSIDNNGTSGCNMNWWWNAGYGGNVWSERVGYDYGSIGSSNDQFSSDSWCST